MPEKISSFESNILIPEEIRDRVFHVFTIISGKVQVGANIEKFSLKGAGVDIPAIQIGETGRGRLRGVLPVQLASEQQDFFNRENQAVITLSRIGQTKTGKPKLISSSETPDDSHVIAVLRTPIGYRGGNAHTGDMIGTKKNWRDEDVPDFGPFPGYHLSHGVIAQGDAGRMGEGDQYVSIIPKNKVFRTGYSGRLYGAPSSHYYLWNGEKMLSATFLEREVSGIF